jgi:hypothetical protein
MDGNESTLVRNFQMDGARAILAASPAALHLQQQILAIEKAVSETPALAIDLAKTLVETVCKTILTDLNVAFTSNEDCHALMRQTLLQMRLFPDGHLRPAEIQGQLTKLTNNLISAVQCLSEIRNREGLASHGRDAFASSLDNLQAEFAARSADAVVRFMWAAHTAYTRAATKARMRYEEMDGFNDWIDNVVNDEPLLILNNVYKPSEVLFKVDFDAYRAAYPDYEQFREGVKEYQ